MIKCINPSNGTVLAEIEETKASEIRRIVAQAKNKSVQWQNTDINQRIACIKKLADVLEEKKDSFADIINKET